MAHQYQSDTWSNDHKIVEFKALGGRHVIVARDAEVPILSTKPFLNRVDTYVQQASKFPELEFVLTNSAVAFDYEWSRTRYYNVIVRN